MDLGTPLRGVHQQNQLLYVIDFVRQKKIAFISMDGVYAEQLPAAIAASFAGL